MIIENLDGFVLGKASLSAQSGQPWPFHGAPIAIYTDLNLAKKAVIESQTNFSKPHPVWTSVYAVSASNIDCVELHGDGTFVTVQAHKIITKNPVFYSASTTVSNNALSFARARKLQNFMNKLK